MIGWGNIHPTNFQQIEGSRILSYVGWELVTNFTNVDNLCGLLMWHASLIETI